MLYSKRVRKKKQLTDPVEIIPFTNQLNKNTPKPHVTPAVTQNKEYLQQKIEAKILSVPTGNLNTTNPSIKKILQQKEQSPVQSSINQKDLPYESFSYDQVKMAWRRYAHEAKAKGMETFYNAMIKRDPKQILCQSWWFSHAERLPIIGWSVLHGEAVGGFHNWQLEHKRTR